MNSWLPTAPHRMAAPSHEETRGFYHPVGDLSLYPINLREPILFLEQEAKLLSLSRHFLLVVNILSLQLFLCLKLEDRGEVDLGILCACKAWGGKVEKNWKKVCLDNQ